MKVNISFDGNYRERLWTRWNGDQRAILRALLGKARIAFINEKDVALVLGSQFDQAEVMERRRAAATAAFEAFPDLQKIYSTVRNMRSMQDHDLSAALFTRTHELRSRTYALRGITDRVGAGDAFAAGALHGILANYADHETLEFATAAAALKHSVPGDFNLVSVKDVQQVLTTQEIDIRR